MRETVGAVVPPPAERLLHMRTAPSGPHYPYAPRLPADIVDIWGTLDIFRRRKGLLLVIAAVLMALYAFAVFQLTPVYQASTVVMTNEQGSDLLNISENKAQFPDPEAIQSEVQILASRNLAEEIIAKLNLADDPEFNPFRRKAAANAAGPFSLRSWSSAVMTTLFPPPADGIKSTPEIQNAAVLQTFARKLAVFPVGRSRALRISFESTSPLTAASVANTMAESYRQRKVDMQTTAYQNTILWVTAHLAEAEQNLNASRKKLGVARQLAMNVDDASSPIIQNLRTQQALLEQKVANLKAKYGPDYPDLQAAHSELESLKATIQAETNKIIRDLTGSDPKNATVPLHEKAKGQNGDNTVTVLEREVAAQDALYTDLLARSKRLEMERGVQWAVPDIISRADVPTKPSFPNKPILLLLGAFLSLMAGAATVFVIEKRNMTIITTQQAERSLGANVLGLIPAVAPLSAPGTPFSSASVLTRQNESSVFSESIRNLHVKLVLHNGGPPKTVMMSSAVPGEGKTSVALALSLLVAGTGRRVVLVDCDVRRPRVHSALSWNVSPGLTEYLRGKADLASACRHEPKLHLDVITAGQPYSHPADLLSGAAMQGLLDKLKADYDMVVVDAPPVQAVADALVLAPHIDTTVFLVHWHKTPEQVAMRAIGQLGAAGADIAGVVLTRVDINKVLRDRLEDYYSYGALDYARTA